MRHRITHRYTSMRDGNRYGPWAAGSVVDLDPDEAAWINVDSPGTCVSDEPEALELAAVQTKSSGPEPGPDAVPKPEAESKEDAQVIVLAVPESAVEPEAEVESDNTETAETAAEPETAEKKAPARNRKHTPARTR